MRLYVKDAIGDVLSAIHGLRLVLVDLAEANSGVIMPGYTHLQRAQPVLFAHHMLAYFEMLGRDGERFRQARGRADVLPLGSGALAGVPYPVDRDFLAGELGFAAVSANSMDAVSDRDFLLDFHAASAICATHLSRMAEEIVVWSSDEFGFIRLSDDYTTGSSIMPQKRNPDFAELARGKTGRVFGNLVATLTVLKGLPMTYNRDLQEDKEPLFDTVDTLVPTLSAMAGMVSSLELRKANLRRAAEAGYILATDVADYLVARGMPFREAHGLAARVSARAYDEGKGLDELSLDAYKEFSPLFEEDVLSITVDSSITARDVPGGTSPGQVRQALAGARAELEAEGGR
jgi:argininosuccinate lyase